MEALYIKLYEKYSKLKAVKDAELSKANEDQEVKFVEFVSAAETLIEHLTSENKRLCENIDELRDEVWSLSAAKDQQFDEFQERLMGEKQKNHKLSAEIEQLRNMQHEGIFPSNRSEKQEDQHVNSIEHSPRVSVDQSNRSPSSVSRKRASECSPRVSGDQFNDSSMRMTRKRARLFAETNSAINNQLVCPRIELSTGKDSSADHPISNKKSPLPECCQTNIDSGGPYTCLFQNLVECLIGMKVSIVDQPEKRCLRATHLSSGYSFSLTWMNKTTPDEGEMLYSVSSLGTFAKVAPEWMREVIIFSMSMCPIFFERVTRVIKQL